MFIGTLLEGETILLAAGFAAQQGLLDLRVVMAIAFVGATLGDQAAFLLGRWKGEALIARFPVLARHAPRVHRLLEQFDALFVILVRFVYGMRIAGPVIMGTSRVPLARFSVLNMVGAVLWAVLIADAGYLFGSATESLLGRMEHIEGLALLGILAAGFLLWLWHHLRRRGRD